MKNKRVTGGRGEDEAIRFLLARNYRIIARNYFCPFGEIDIIAEKRGVLSFVEVKTRYHREKSDILDPLFAITKKKLNRLAKSAEHYIGALAINDSAYQIDVLTVMINKGQGGIAIEHRENITQ